MIKKLEIISDHRKKIIGDAAEERAMEIFNHLKKTEDIQHWRYSAGEEDTVLKIDFIITLLGGQECFIDVKAMSLEEHGAKKGWRFFSKERNGLYILYYNPSFEDEISKEALNLLKFMKAHIGQLRARNRLLKH